MQGRALVIVAAAMLGYHLLAHAETVAASSGRVPHDDFREGFIVGYQVVRGTGAAIPAQPATPADRTPFLVGVRSGIEQAAGIRLN